MTEIAPTTDGNAAPGTDAPATDAPATQPADTAPAATEDATVTLSQKDYKNLVSQRDRANNANDQQASFINTLAKERGITEFLESNKSKYPDLNLSDLAHVEDPDDLEGEATRLQKRLEDAVQAKLLDVQKVSEPFLSPEQRAEEEKKLKKNPGKSSFARMVELRLRPTR